MFALGQHYRGIHRAGAAEHHPFADGKFALGGSLQEELVHAIAADIKHAIPFHAKGQRQGGLAGPVALDRHLVALDGGLICPILIRIVTSIQPLDTGDIILGQIGVVEHRRATGGRRKLFKVGVGVVMFGLCKDDLAVRIGDQRDIFVCRPGNGQVIGGF